jgi:hypothetical protein
MKKGRHPEGRAYSFLFHSEFGFDHDGAISPRELGILVITLQYSSTAPENV